MNGRPALRVNPVLRFQVHLSYGCLTEITNSFAALLDTVRSHLISKISLYANLEARCARQMQEIEDNKRELGKVRKEMESGAGGVVGVDFLKNNL